MPDRFSNFPNDEEERLANLARRDAARISPAFSPVLHAKMLGAVSRAGVEPRSFVIERHAKARLWIAPLAAAATIALVTMSSSLFHAKSARPVSVIVSHESIPIPAPVHSEAPPVLQIEAAVNQANVHARDLVQTAMNRQQWAGLDQDVRAATQYLVDQVPFRTAWESAAQDR